MTARRIAAALLAAGGLLLASPAQAAPPYANCAEAIADGAAPILRGEPGYRPALDRDNDGVACDRDANGNPVTRAPVTTVPTTPPTTAPTTAPSDDPEPAATTSRPATSSPTPDRTSEAPAAPSGPSDQPGVGGGLPVTGPTTGIIAGLGALLLCGGAALIVLVRHRRRSRRFVA